jgi:hypothetical protein
MESREAAVNERSLREVQQNVRMGHVVQTAKYPVGKMMFVHPSQLDRELGQFKMVPEEGLILMPSPFRTEKAPNSALVVLPENNTWTDVNGLVPKHIPNDPVGFVMATQRTDIARAVEALFPLAREIRRNPEGPVASLEDFRIYVRLMARRALARAS